VTSETTRTVFSSKIDIPAQQYESRVVQSLG
jgi:hypothetical protein